MFLAANSVALCYFLGPKKSTAVALNSALLCAGGKFVHVLFTTAKEKVPCVVALQSNCLPCVSLESSSLSNPDFDTRRWYHSFCAVVPR